METLEELKNTYKKLQEESNNLYSKIKALEKRNAISKFTVGHRVYKIDNGFSIRVNITIKEVNRI